MAFHAQKKFSKDFYSHSSKVENFPLWKSENENRAITKPLAEKKNLKDVLFLHFVSETLPLAWTSKFPELLNQVDQNEKSLFSVRRWESYFLPASARPSLTSFFFFQLQTFFSKQGFWHVLFISLKFVKPRVVSSITRIVLATQGFFLSNQGLF